MAASEWARELDAVPAEERRKRPLFGIPMSIKECFKVKGIMENNYFLCKTIIVGTSNKAIYNIVLIFIDKVGLHCTVDCYILVLVIY